MSQTELKSFKFEYEFKEANVLNYLAQFSDHRARNEQLLKAINVGIIALQSARPMKDLKIVQEKYDSLHNRIQTYEKDFETQLDTLLQDYITGEGGQLPSLFTKYFGEEGLIPQLFTEYFGEESGKIYVLLESLVGEDSEFLQTLDPSNPESPFAELPGKVGEIVGQKMADVVKNLKFGDGSTSADKLEGAIQADLRQFHSSLEEFGKKLKDLIQDTGTKTTVPNKKNELEDYKKTLQGVLPTFVTDEGDELVYVGDNVGHLQREKSGAYLLTLQTPAPAKGKQVVVEVLSKPNLVKRKVKVQTPAGIQEQEVKESKPLSLLEARENLKIAKENRGVAFGIYIFPKEYAPQEINQLRVDNQDIYLEVDEDLLPDEKSLEYFKVALDISRVLCCMQEITSKTTTYDQNAIKAKITAFYKDLQQSDELCETINKMYKIAASIYGKLSEKNFHIKRQVVELVKQLDVDLHLEDISEKSVKVSTASPGKPAKVGKGGK